MAEEKGCRPYQTPKGQSYSDLIKLTVYEGKRRCFVDPKIIVRLVDLGENDSDKRTRIDIIDDSKVVCGAYLVTEDAVYINTQIENIIARNEAKKEQTNG